MALIKCAECGRDVSDQAPSCPNCGAPIASAQESKAAGAQLVTIQGTSKKLKLQTLLSGSLVALGMIIIVAAGSNETGSGAGLGGTLLTIGLIWFIVTRIRTWWHHD